MTLNKTLRYGLRLGILLIILLWSGFPILMVILSSFKDPKSIFDYPPKLIFNPTITNYFELAKDWPEYFLTLWNSLVITVGATFVTIVFSFLAGYAYSRFRSRILSLSAFFMLIVRMLPPIVITIPLYPVLSIMGLFDKHITLIVIYAVFYLSLGTFLMRTFIDQIPIELDESAFIDGASHMQVMFRIVLPLSLHGIMATATFVIIFAWKEYMYALLFTTTKAKTAPVIISEMLSSVVGVSWGPVFAAATLQLVPLLIYVLVVQRLLVEGMLAGSIKG